MKNPQKPLRNLGISSVHLFCTDTLVAGVGLEPHGLAAARSRLGSDDHSGRHSLPRRRSRSALTTSGLFARAHNSSVICAKLKFTVKMKNSTIWVLFFVLVAGVGLEPHDLRVMSPTSYQLLYPAILVPETGIEPARDLSPTGF